MSETPWWEAQEILGRLRDDTVWEYAIILQGPKARPNTQISIRKFLENSDQNTLVIVSTYNPVLITMSRYEREVIDGRSVHAGRLIYLSVKPPNKEECPEFWDTNKKNQNLQRLSSYVGLQFAAKLGIERSLKCRADAFFMTMNVCHILKTQYHDVFPPTCEPEVNMRGRIVVSNRTEKEEPVDPNVKVPVYGRFHVADFWLFGFTSDLLTFFNISPGSLPIEKTWAPESNLAERWMREAKMGSQITGTTELAARYLVIVNSDELEFFWPGRWHSFFMLNRRGKGHLLAVERAAAKNSRCGLLSHADWLEIMRKY